MASSVLRALSHSERSRGPTDKASDYESGDSRFESWRGRCYFDSFIILIAFHQIPQVRHSEVCWSRIAAFALKKN